MSKPKANRKGLAKLNEIFRELGGKEIPPDAPSKIDAEMIAESAGVHDHNNARQNDLPHCERTGKVCYPSHNIAHQIKRRRQSHGAQRLRIYFCDHCHCHHLTSYA